MEYGEAAGSPTVLISASRTRHKLAMALADRQDVLKDLELRIVEADLLNGTQISAVIAPFQGLLDDRFASSFTRARAAVHLMTIADRELEDGLAKNVFAALHCLQDLSPEAEVTARRAGLVFHTFCGDAEVARSLAYELLNRFPSPSARADSIKARQFASFALLRLRDYETAARTCAASYEHLLAHGIYNHAVYAAVTLSSVALAIGDFPTARIWVLNAKDAVRGGAAHEVSPNAGLHSNEAMIAMYEGHYDEAESLIFAPGRESSLLTSSRNRAVCLAMSVRLKQLKGEGLGNERDLTELEALYAKGCGLGGQDLIVEALWSARTLTRDTNGASALLQKYLESRRECGNPDWTLRSTTAADKAWLILS